MRWLTSTKITEDFLKEYKKEGFSDIMAQVLFDRDITPQIARLIIDNPMALIENPYDIYGAKQAATSIIKFLKEGYKFLVFADYDVDGMTSGYIMTDFMRQLGADIYCYYPERKEGYGLSKSFIDKIDIKEGPWCIITVDNGISCVAEVAYALSLGIQVVITDHHERNRLIPLCDVSDPWVDCKAGKHLCGAAVAWKICLIMEDMLEKATGEPLDIAENYIPYVGIGTVSDVMPMTNENRALVNLALDKMNEYKLDPFIAAMKDSFGIRKITAKDIVWTIAPNLNGASRMGDVQLAAGSFYETDIGKLMDNFVAMNRHNNKRKALQKEAVEKALKNDYSNDPIVMFDVSEYPQGLWGVVAGRLAETFNKPAIAYKDMGDMYVGSCRSIEGVDIKKLISIEVFKGNALAAEGHSGACVCNLIRGHNKDFLKGIKESLAGNIPDLTGTPLLPKESIIDEAILLENSVLVNETEESILEKYMADGKDLGTPPDIEPNAPKLFNVDVDIDIKDITKSLLDELNDIPFNKDWPMFRVKCINPIFLSPFKNKDHLIIQLGDSVALGWNMKPDFPGLTQAESIEIIGNIEPAGFTGKYYGCRVDDPIVMIKDIIY